MAAKTKEERYMALLNAQEELLLATDVFNSPSPIVRNMRRRSELLEKAIADFKSYHLRYMNG